MSNLTTYGDITPRTGGYAKAKLLERGQHMMTTERFGMVDPHQKHKTKTVKWRRYNSIPRATAPVAEGIPPASHKLTYTDITATMEEYIEIMELTDVISDMHEDPVLNQMITIIGEAMGETIEEVRINFLKAGTNVFYANGAASRSAVNSPPTRGDFRKIYRYFKKYKAREVSEMISATAKISTEPVAMAYFAMGHTDLLADIKGISGFTPYEQYSDSMKRLPGEVGKIEEFRIILTAMFSPWSAAGTAGTTYLSGGIEVSSSTACDVYPLLFTARDAYGIVPLQGFNAVHPMVLNPGTPSKSDPAGQKGYVSAKTFQTGAILNQNWFARLECAATASPS